MTNSEPDPESDRRDDDRHHWVPRPPRAENSADFIVIVFAVTIATILVILTIGIVVGAFFTDAEHIKSYFAILTSIVTSMISALVGYLAGKGVGSKPPDPPAPS